MSSSSATVKGGASQNRRFISLGAKLAAAIAAIVAVASALVFVDVTSRERQNAVDAKLQAAAMVVDLFASSLADMKSSTAIKGELERLEATLDVTYAAAWAPWGELPIAEVGTRPDGVPLGAAGGGRESRVWRDGVEVFRPVVARDGKRMGSLALRFSLARENAAYADARRHMLWLCVLLATGTLASLLATVRRWIVSPLDKLGEAARRVERGEEGARVAVGANDEMGRVAVAFNAMHAAIVDREQRLAAANESLRELFDHMSEAIVVFGNDGELSGAGSREARVVFGDPEGLRIRDLLYGDAATWNVEARAFDDWVASAFDVPLEAWPSWAELAPRAVTLHEGTPLERSLSLEFRPIVQGDRIVRIMLLATDTTERQRLRREVEAHVDELAVVRRRVAGGGEVFVTFLAGARRRIARSQAILGAIGTSFGGRELSADELDEVFRNVHTVKGEALTFDLTELADYLGRLESRLDDARKRLAAPFDPDEEPPSAFPLVTSLSAGLDAAIYHLDQSEQLFVAASPLGRGALDQTTVSRSDVARLGELVRGGGDEVARIAARLASRPFGEIVASLAEKVPAWAENVGKQAHIEVDGREVLIPPALAQLLRGIMTHLVRNAVAHGIESPEERVRAGKDRAGLLALRCIEGTPGPTIELSDDGQGIVEDAVRQRAAELGAGSRDSLTDLVFTPGLTTAERATVLSGRGVGLSAAREELREVGYAIQLHSEAGRGASFLLRPAVDGARVA